MLRLTIAVVAAVMAVGVVAPASADSRIAVEWIQATCSVDAVVPHQSGGALHMRGETHHDVIYMDLGEGHVPVGTNLIVFNYDISLKTLNGRGGGTFLAALPAYETSFEGRFNGGIKNGMLTARAIGAGHGGAFDGARMTATITQFQPTLEQLGWMCDGADVVKTVAVSALIRP
ncbi:MAG: hypothetical protein HKO63_03105 [Acidimicrobiia bacterium]|nr:hypothetical protein [Acidimicrobiia bacterium]MBT8192403.1 hypothetical protein [Acidimicrobiia bacterium]MBT8246846.1 hypothetical protein [Acidimicrobiia bacterium]NNF87258.1 hypothetical protein [Acidimicrobiia bacterium]NNJ47759.1 hypothetical protein [Acidimicrobiia bacterium]